MINSSSTARTAAPSAPFIPGLYAGAFRAHPVMSACLCVSSASVACAGTSAPDDVGLFIRNADNCEHMAGEWDSTLSKAEKQQIKRSVIRYCGAAKKQLKTLKIKYKDEVDVKKILADHEYDSVTSFAK